MTDTQLSPVETHLISGFREDLNSGGEEAFSRVLNGIIDCVKKKYADAQVRLGTPFVKYLHNAVARYNRVKTLATGTTPRSIIGPGNLYISIGVDYKEKRIGTETLDPLLQLSKHILIEGTGGIGKTFLLRYLFLNTAHRGEYIPVLLDLRKISQLSGKLSIPELIYTCLKSFDISLDPEQFEFSLGLGKYCFLMDGFDEIKSSLANESAVAIQEFCAKYPDNPCIITSRPRQGTRHLETFTVVRSCPLTMDQAVSLSKKLWEEDEKTLAFCKELETGLFEKHKDFAENPLLLSMMFLTFMRNNSISDRLAEFYRKAFDALYNAHDSNNKGYYVREFACKELDEPGFKDILMHFCFQSYMHEEYEFTEEQILGKLRKSIEKFGYKDLKAEDYLKDLRQVVCLIVEDGEISRFSHRSFQTYFAACYTATLTDERQKKLFEALLYDPKAERKIDYFDLLLQIEGSRFAENALEQPLRTLQEELATHNHPDVYLMRQLHFYFPLLVERDGKAEKFIYTTAYSALLRYGEYSLCIALFKKYMPPCEVYLSDTEEQYLINSILKVKGVDPVSLIGRRVRFAIKFAEIDACSVMGYKERMELLKLLSRSFGIPQLISSIDHWLSDLDRQRQESSDRSFIDDL